MKYIQILVAAIWIGMFVLPLGLLLNSIPSGFWQDATTSSKLLIGTRFLGLIVFTLITQQILMQVYRPFFNKNFDPKIVKRYHIIAGTFTLLLAFMHPFSHDLALLLLKVPFMDIISGRFYETPERYFYFLGPVTLTLLVCTVAAGLLRNWAPLQKYWYAIHRINYLLFFVAFLHSWNMGEDLKSFVALRILWVTYAVLISYGIVSKFYLRPHAIRNAAVSTSTPSTTQAAS